MADTQTQGDSREPRTLALDRYSEQTRRDLYDLVVEMQFSPIEGAGPDDYPGPSYTPDEAGLVVFYLYSRWFATWTSLDEKRRERRIELVRLEADSAGPSAWSCTRSEILEGVWKAIPLGLPSLAHSLGLRGLPRLALQT